MVSDLSLPTITRDLWQIYEPADRYYTLITFLRLVWFLFSPKLTLRFHWIFGFNFKVTPIMNKNRGFTFNKNFILIKIEVYSLLLCGLFYEAICCMSFHVSFCSCVFSPFSIAITSLREERANLSAFRTFVRFVLVWICRFPLPLGVWEGLRFVIVALPGLFSFFFFPIKIEQWNWHHSRAM